jgi:hypothetical protein
MARACSPSKPARTGYYRRSMRCSVSWSRQGISNYMDHLAQRNPLKQVWQLRL